MRKVIAALISIAAIAFPQVAIAQTTANRDANNNIIVSGTGLAPDTLVKIWYPKVPDKQNVTTIGACNLLTLRSSANFDYVDFVKINGTQLNLSFSNWVSLTAPPCLKGVANTAYTWTTAGGYRYVEGKGKTYVLAPSPGSFAVETDTGNFRLGRVDKCGRISIKNSERWPIAGLNVGNGTFSYASNSGYGPDLLIPSTPSTAMPICYRGILYRPLNP